MMSKRYDKTPSNIKYLKEDEVFVFGSNLSGHHGLGGALTALKWGAVMGKGIGHHGQTYAIPTKKHNFKYRLELQDIQTHVHNFIKYAKDNPDKIFLVTLIGCGLAGYSTNSIKPFFSEANEILNIILPIEFQNDITN